MSEDDRGDTPKLTWRLLLKAVPLYAVVYFIIIVAVAVTAAPEWQRLIIAVSVAAVSVTFLDIWFRPRVGLTAEKEERERIWASASETPELIAKQAVRYLVLALPVILLSVGVAGVAATALLKKAGVW